MSDELLDVIQIGYGPVSEVSAMILGRQGRSVAVFERWKQRYPLPRAVCIDHEMYRMLSAVGLSEQLPGLTHSAPVYRWFNAQWRELLSIDWSVESISGGPEVNFVHQPTLEETFDLQVRLYPTVAVHLGWEAVAVSQTTDYAEVIVRNNDTGEERTHRAKYIIGADGANSIVRSAIGSGQQDRGFEADWLVIDILPNEGAELNIPPAAQWCNPVRPTTIVPAGIRDGRYYRRWEFMRLPHETVADIENEQTAWELLAPWVRPDQATMVRHKVYTFRSLLADRWRNGRLVIAGDAAHVMPPFMGQGMCAGLRDVWNLGWRLNLILDGRADDVLLDTYQRERSPHVSDIIELSMYLGRIVCQPDVAKTEERDRAFFDGTHPLPAPFPHLVDGLLARGADGAPTEIAGFLSPHGHVRVAGREGRFDDVVGTGFVLISRGPLPDLTARQTEQLARLQMKTLDLTAAGVEELEGKYKAFLDAHGVAAIVVRPDFYVFGGATTLQAIGDLIGELAAGVFGATSELPQLAQA